MTSFADLFAQCAGRSFAKQLAFEEWLGKHRWNLDIEKGTVDFGKSGVFGKSRISAVQLVGTQAEASNSFLWAWANAKSGLPARVLQAVESIRQFGGKHGIRELTEPSLSTADWDGHQIAMIATSIVKAPAYYRGPYEGGAVFFLVMDAPPLAALPVERIVTVMSQVISNWELDHRAMAAAFLQQEGFALEQQGAALSATHDDGRGLNLEFDPEGRIAELSATIGKKA